MKKLSFPAIAILILGLVIAIGSQTFLGPCVHEDGSLGVCHWAGRMMMGVGALLAVLAALALLMPQLRSGLMLAMLPTALLGLLTPGTIISICRMDTMRCRMVMRPAMLILCAIVMALALGGWLVGRGKRG